LCLSVPAVAPAQRCAGATVTSASLIHSSPSVHTVIFAHTVSPNATASVLQATTGDPFDWKMVAARNLQPVSALRCPSGRAIIPWYSELLVKVTTFFPSRSTCPSIGTAAAMRGRIESAFFFIHTGVNSQAATLVSTLEFLHI
jgi:hypothetical protein